MPSRAVALEPKIFGWKLLLLAGLLLWVYAPTLLWMADRWFQADSYYTHGPLVPFISGWLLWRQRQELAALPLRPSDRGILFMLAGVLLQVVSAFARIYFTSALSFFVLLVGMILASGGGALLRRAWFPVAFLLFMVPMPLASIASVSLQMKLFAASMASRLLWWFGIPTLQDGSLLRLPHCIVIVEDLCSGLRSLIALISLGVLCAYLMRSTWWKRGILLLATLPIAIGANVFRITVVSLVSELYGAQWASGIFHDAMGFVSFIVAYAGLTALRSWLR